jgi:peptidyl-prolyl cis-trans isomerase C
VGLLRAKSGLAVVFGLGLVGLWGHSAAGADEDSTVVARVGTATLSAGAVRRRMAELSAPELGRLGVPPAEAPRRIIEAVLSLELAAEQEARARGLDKDAGTADRTRHILGRALDRALGAEALAKPVADQEIAQYFEQNRSRFEQPARVRVWRILLDSEAQAQKVLNEAKAAGDTSKWSELTRQHSIDKATNMRQGDLGFVRADGSTDVPRVRVDPAIYTAVESLKDGEMSPQPVAEAGKFAVLWRRGSLPKKVRTLDQERDTIRRLLERRRVEEAKTRLLAELKKAHVREERPELLEVIPEGVLGDMAAPSTRTTPLATRPSEAGSEPPKPTERGLR